MPPRPLQHSNQFHDTRHTYVPEHAQRLIAQRQQQTGEAGFPQLNQSPPPSGQPLPQQPRPAPQPQVQVQPAQSAPAPEPYDFIMNPGQEPKQGFSLPGANSMLKRVVFAVAGLAVLLTLFIIIKGVLSGGSDLPLFVGIAQDQQEMLHLTNPTGTSGQQPVLSAANQNFAATTRASLTSSQAGLIQYLANNKTKVSAKQLNLKLSQQLDTQLTNATAAGTYDTTFQQIMKAQLTRYLNDLNNTYNKATGKKGRALLKNDYNQANLLLTQLNAPGGQ